MKRLMMFVHLLLLLALGQAALAQPKGFSARDQQQGAQVREQILRQFGGEMQGPAADYVRGVAQRVVVHTDPAVRAGDYRVSVLNSAIPNAMATPGGYLYVTRGLLVLMNSEAELASVLGHEAGHVAAAHSQRSQRRSTLATILGTVATIATGSDLVGMGSQLLGGLTLAQFSQKQEFEADMLGLRYMTSAGYDPWATPEMLAALERAPVVEGKTAAQRYGAASWFSTHPVTSERVARAQQLARGTGRAPGAGTVNRNAFLAAIDGLTWGDDPGEGIIVGQGFRHGPLGIGFDAPPGVRMVNSPTQVVGEGEAGAFRFVAAPIQPGQPLEEVARQAWAGMLNGRVPDYSRESGQVNGLEAVSTFARLSGQSGALDTAVTVIRGGPSSAYVLVTQARAGRLSGMAPLVNSFRRLTPAEVQEASRGLKVRVVTVKPGDTAASLAERMAFPDNRLTRFLALNGIENRPLQPGERLKIITRG
jgi:predicted Zn-dependent protease